jgi:hypothetical protein
MIGVRSSDIEIRVCDRWCVRELRDEAHGG